MLKKKYSLEIYLVLIKKNVLMKKAIVTGASGYWFFVCKKLKDQGFNIVGIDDLNDYYDLTLKKVVNIILQMS